MTINYSIQMFIVIAIVGISALYMLGKLLPRWRKNAGLHLQLTQYPAWVNAIGVKWSGGGAGCGSGCDTCGTCETPKKTTAPSTTLH
ncbi:MAG: hypothetical protein JWM78_2594 [Verrucomicrobiaceae bacterium]|nr:hypothetical protein [Verrucomicrobiaceae bacterium]